MEQLNKIGYEEYIQHWKENNKELIEKGKIKKVFTEHLIKDNKSGIKIRWNMNIGKLVYFIYDNIEGYVEIVDCSKKKCTIKYKDDVFSISKDSLLGCKLGEILKVNTSDFKVEIGTTYKNDKRNITITDREYRKDEKGRNWKWYKYTCNQCGWTKGWMTESCIKNIGCSCCSGKTVVEGINSIVDTDKWMIPYFQGGYNEAKLYTRKSGKKINPICPDCKRVKSTQISIDSICRRKTISCSCSDKNPYTEKLMFSVLEQLGVKFEYHKTFEWSKDIQIDNIELCGRKEYDFSFKINNEDFVTETHGIQHYEESNRGRSLKIEQANDELKKELALSNGIKEENYIVIDCRYSESEWIKNNENGILNSRLNELFDLSIIDWAKAEEFALSNRIREACNLYNSNPELSVPEIASLMNMDRLAVRKYIKKGTELKWCNYNAELVPNHDTSISIVCIELKTAFTSARQCSINSEKIFGIKLNETSIARACKSGKKHKGYTFKYTSDLTEQELKQLNQAI